MSSPFSPMFPVGEVVSVIHKRLRKDKTLGDRTFLLLNKSRATGDVPADHLLQLWSNFYEQKEGLSMGFPVSVVVGKFYDLEKCGEP